MQLPHRMVMLKGIAQQVMHPLGKGWEPLSPGDWIRQATPLFRNGNISAMHTPAARDKTAQSLLSPHQAFQATNEW